MGCDIHLIIERRVKGQWCAVHEGYNHYLIGTHLLDLVHVMKKDIGSPTKAWELARKLQPLHDLKDRDYLFFGLIADVRATTEYNLDPRGVPPDLSPIAEQVIEDEGCDGHSHSWLPLAEFVMRKRLARAAESIEDLDKGFGALAAQKLLDDKEFNKQLALMVGMDEYDFNESSFDPNDFRVIFWFDN